jgi:TRAP-type C4-dicarboxylate transport system permease small subunit
MLKVLLFAVGTVGLLLASVAIFLATLRTISKLPIERATLRGSQLLRFWLLSALVFGFAIVGFRFVEQAGEGAARAARLCLLLYLLVRLRNKVRP